MIRLNIDLNNPSSYIKSERQLLNMLRTLEIGIDNAVDNAMREIASLARIELLKQLTLYGLGDSTFVERTNINFFPNGFELRVDSDHAVFVEFGTGVVGQSSPFKGDTKEVSSHGTWVYATNGKEGWWYPSEEEVSEYSVYDESKGIYFNFTRGQESRPFTYNTYLYTMRIAPKVLKKHLDRIESKVAI